MRTCTRCAAAAARHLPFTLLAGGLLSNLHGVKPDVDVLVIGGGIAGVSAALAAAGRGARVLLVRAGPGATALCAGGWRTAPPDPIRSALEKVGLALARVRGALPHPDGDLATHEIAPVSHAACAVDGSGAMLVCGIAGLSAFRSRALAALWSDAAGLPVGAIAAAAVTLDGTPAAGWSPVALAALLEREPERLTLPLSRLARERGAARIILPAVLGLEAHAAVYDAVRAPVDAEIGEALGTVPSVPGWRLDAALRSALDDAGIAILTGRVVSTSVDAGRVASITVQLADGTRGIAAPVYVLATGRYVGGGITAAPRFIETVFDLDVAPEVEGRRIDDATDSRRLTLPPPLTGGPLFEAGIRTVADGRPATRTGDVALRNVVVAGSVRAGASTITLGLGTAAHDGWTAGEHAAAGVDAWR